MPGQDNTFEGFRLEFRNASVAVFASGECLRLSDSGTVINGKGVRVAF